jgi:nitrous oxidase accessory protein
VVRLIAIALAAALAAGTPAAHAAECTVSPTSFASALAAAKPGDALRLAPGIYRGPLTITTPSLRIAGADGAVIDGGGNGTAITIAADGVVLDGPTIRNPGRDLAGDDAAVLIRDAHRATVRHCRIEARAFGIYLRAGGDHLIADNDIRGDLSLARSSRGNGIHLWHTARNQVLRNRITGARDGLYLSFAQDNVIRDNLADDVRYGIHYMYSDHNLVADNRFERCLGGATLMFSKRNTLTGNRAVDNRHFGILLLDVDSTRLDANLLARNERGFVIDNSNADRFERNRIEDNGVGVFVSGGSESDVFTGNAFDGNVVQAYVGHAGINAWSEHGRGNFWSDYAGFDFDGNGIGEAPYRLQNGTSALLALRPAARWFMMSPALALLDWFEQRTVAPGDEFIDRAPLVAAPQPR